MSAGRDKKSLYIAQCYNLVPSGVLFPPPRLTCLEQSLRLSWLGRWFLSVGRWCTALHCTGCDHHLGKCVTDEWTNLCDSDRGGHCWVRGTLILSPSLNSCVRMFAIKTLPLPVMWLCCSSLGWPFYKCTLGADSGFCNCLSDWLFLKLLGPLDGWWWSK